MSVRVCLLLLAALLVLVVGARAAELSDGPTTIDATGDLAEGPEDTGEEVEISLPARAGAPAAPAPRRTHATPRGRTRPRAHTASIFRPPRVAPLA